MNRNTKAALSYLTWIAGLIFLVTDQDRFVKENAAQSTILGLGVMIVNFILNWIPIIRYLMFLIWLAYIIVAILCILNASKGQMTQIPVVSDFAHNLVGK